MISLPKKKEKPVVLAIMSVALLVGLSGSAWSQRREPESRPNLEEFFPSVEQVIWDELAGIPTWVHGDLGSLPADDLSVITIEFMLNLAPVYNLTDPDRFQLERIEQDDLEMTHIWLNQYHEQIPVDGGHIAIHVDPRGVVRTINGYLGAGIDIEPTPDIEKELVVVIFQEISQVQDIEVLSDPELVYWARPETETKLAWKVDLMWMGIEREQVIEERIYLDAISGDLIEQESLRRHALYREIYDKKVVPANLLCKEGDTTCPGAKSKKVYDNIGIVYNFYSDKFKRDSIDDNGMVIKAVVHIDENNASWSTKDKIMLFGDGDGVNFLPFGNALDVVAHEYTHGVTDHTAKLKINDETGALDEGFADILAAACEAYNGSSSNIYWMHGEDCHNTPTCATDAERYLDDPLKAGFERSRDYYPDRYIGGEDYGGIHVNSGIANLAFHLLVEGGQHPHLKSSTVVPAIGMRMAEAIFYRALSFYITPTSNFKNARMETALSAKELYGVSAEEAVHLAWNAVGVPGTPKQVYPHAKELKNKLPETGLSDSIGYNTYFLIRVPTGQKSLTVTIAGGTGNCDLFVNHLYHLAMSYGYTSTNSGNNDSVNIPKPSPGDWYIKLTGASDYSSVQLTASYDHGAKSFETEYGRNNSTKEPDKATMLSNAKSMRVIGYIAKQPCNMIDVDYYDIVLEAGERVEVNMSVPSDMNYDIKLLDVKPSLPATTLAHGKNGYGKPEHITWQNNIRGSKRLYLYVYGVQDFYATNEEPYILDIKYEVPTMIPDQVNDASTNMTCSCFGPPTDGGSLYQSFDPFASPLVAVTLSLIAGPDFPYGTGHNTTVRIRQFDQFDPTGTILGTAQAFVNAPQPAPNSIYTWEPLFKFNPPINMATNKEYAIEWITPKKGGSILRWWIADGNPYIRGRAYGCKGNIFPNDDFIFTTYVSP